MRRSIYINSILLLVLLGQAVMAQPGDLKNGPAAPWVDSVMRTLTLEEMIGQLIMVRANNPGAAYFPEVSRYIHDYGIGGVTFFGGKPYAQAVQTNQWQKQSRVPLLVSIDAEWGLGMRLDSTVSFPFQMTLGAIPGDSLLYEMGRQVGQQCSRLGIHMNFAPVVDINSNPSNPVIHMRSFGQDRNNVSAKGIAYMKGLMDAGMLVTAKHFPGHGDTDMDSHYDLPVISHDVGRLDSIELYPFKRMIEAGVNGIMIAHLHIPALDTTENTPSTLSKPIVTGLLRKWLGFQGLIVTDALDMKGVTAHFPPGEIEVRALEAGNDILLLSANVPVAVAAIRKAIEEERISENLIVEKCRKVLTYKFMVGLDRGTEIDLKGLQGDLNPIKSAVLQKEMFAQAVTLVKNKDSILPLKDLDKHRIASVSIGYGEETDFQERLKYYAPVDNFALGRVPAAQEVSKLLVELRPYDLVIVSVQNTGIRTTNNFNISDEAVALIRLLQQDRNIVLDVFASPYSLALFKDMPGLAAVIVSYQDSPVAQDVSAQAIFGGIPFRGRLPVAGSVMFPEGTGLTTASTRLRYTLPEALGIDSRRLTPVDSLIKECIREGVFPGCQVMALKDGSVFFLKSYGKHTYEGKAAVNDFDVYDVASLTKAAASTPALMKLDEEGRIDKDQMLVHYLHYLQGTDKASIILRDMMTHQARLRPWIPFYINVINDGILDPQTFSTGISEEFPVRVAEKVYIRKGYDRVIMDSIIHSALLKTSEYKYSDLGYYFLKEIIENAVNRDLDDFVRDAFYEPLGLSTAGYLPRKRFPPERIVPTEYDRVFRKQLLQGDVHDQGAAMLGGVAGHAGLFSNANDLGIFMQMLLNKGSYGGKKYFEPGTVDAYTQLQNPLNENRRGIGFDKPLIEYEKGGPTCKSASRYSFGHSGFTGTYVWADPANGLIYVFLSNRIHPDAGNNKISKQNIRTRIHQYFYDAIEKSETFVPLNPIR